MVTFSSHPSNLELHLHEANCVTNGISEEELQDVFVESEAVWNLLVRNCMVTSGVIFEGKLPTKEAPGNRYIRDTRRLEAYIDIFGLEFVERLLEENSKNMREVLAILEQKDAAAVPWAEPLEEDAAKAPTELHVEGGIDTTVQLAHTAFMNATTAIHGTAKRENDCTMGA